MTQRQRAWTEYFKNNGTTIISALALGWMIMWQGGGYAVRRAGAFTDTVEVTRIRALETKYNLSVFIDNQHRRDAEQDADISNGRNDKIQSN